LNKCRGKRKKPIVSLPIGCPGSSKSVKGGRIRTSRSTNNKRGAVLLEDNGIRWENNHTRKKCKMTKDGEKRRKLMIRSNEASRSVERKRTGGSPAVDTK